MKVFDMIKDQNLREYFLVVTKTNQELFAIAKVIPAGRDKILAITVQTEEAPALTYDQFLIEYERLLTVFLSYSAEQIGSSVYASELADLVDKYPDFESRYDRELDQRFSQVQNS